MSKIATGAVVAIALLLAGWAAGWHMRGTHDTAAQVAEANQAVDAITASVNAQAAARQAALQAQQSKSVALAAQQAAIRRGSADIQLEITHAVFAPPVEAPAVACPDPTATAEWMRLYNAAGGQPTAAAAAAEAGGVHYLGFEPVPGDAERVAGGLAAAQP